MIVAGKLAAALADFAAGQDSVDAVELLRDALQRWTQSDGAMPLQRYLGLSTPTEFRRDERDRWLHHAAAHVVNLSALAAAIRRFERGAWRLWRVGTVAPAHADELQATLFYARRASDPLPLPESVKQLRRIVGSRDTDSRKHVPKIAA